MNVTRQTVAEPVKVGTDGRLTRIAFVTASLAGGAGGGTAMLTLITRAATVGLQMPYPLPAAATIEMTAAHNIAITPVSPAVDTETMSLPLPTMNYDDQVTVTFQTTGDASVSGIVVGWFDVDRRSQT